MKKELSPSLEMVACDVCGRTILKGERTEPYLVPDGSRRLVCDLCIRRAEGAGWLRESLHGDLPTATPRAEPRRSLLGRLRRRVEDGIASHEGGRGADGGHERGRWPSAAIGGGAGAGEPRRWPGAPAPDFGDRGVPHADDSAAVEEPGYDDRGAGPVEEAEPGAYVEPVEEPPPVGRASRGPLEPVEEAPPEAGPRGREEESLAEPLDESEVVDDLPPLEDVAAEDSALDDAPAGDLSAEEVVLEEDRYPDARTERRERRERRRLRDPRHVRAVPTGAEAKVERALEIFNLSAYRRTVGGLVRTLGPPWVTALPHADSTSEVTLVVAWELSWYQFRVDLGDSAEPVAVADKGHEIDEIDPELRHWNASATDDGALEPGAPAP